MLDALFYYVGLVIVIHQTCTFIFWCYLNFFRTNDLSKYKKGKKEPWALVTGATDGIGKAYAQELALRGFNIFLLSRSEAKLKDVQKEIQDEFKVKVQILAVDAGQATEESFQKIRDQVAPFELSVLVNNVGVTHLPQFLEDADVKEVEGIIKVNVWFSLRLTQILLPQLKNNRSSAIVNVSSLTGTNPTPFVTTYSASKTFNRLFSLSLALEVSKAGVDVQMADPGFVTSNMSRMRRVTFTVCGPRRCANDSLRKLPFQNVTPFWVHGAMVWAFSNTAKPVYDYIVAQWFLSLRQKALKYGLYNKDNQETPKPKEQ